MHQSRVSAPGNLGSETQRRFSCANVDLFGQENHCCRSGWAPGSGFLPVDPEGHQQPLWDRSSLGRSHSRWEVLKCSVFGLGGSALGSLFSAGSSSAAGSHSQGARAGAFPPSLLGTEEEMSSAALPLYGLVCWLRWDAACGLGCVPPEGHCRLEQRAEEDSREDPEGGAPGLRGVAEGSGGEEAAGEAQEAFTELILGREGARKNFLSAFLNARHARASTKLRAMHSGQIIGNLCLLSK